MNTKAISRICGVLYLLTVLAFLPSNLLLKGQLVDAENIPNTLRLVADKACQYRLAVSIDFLAMVGVMALAVSLFVILRPVNPYLALVALGWRIGEVVLQAGAKIPDCLLLKVGESVASSPGPIATEFVTLGQILVAGSTLALWLSFVFLSLGSILSNYLFYKGRLIPIALAVFGLIATGLYALGSVAALVVDIPENVNLALMLPLALFELSLGLYLALFGMRESTS